MRCKKEIPIKYITGEVTQEEKQLESGGVGINKKDDRRGGRKGQDRVVEDFGFNGSILLIGQRHKQDLQKYLYR